MPGSENVRLARTVCPHCHLLTRADYRKCLHCEKPLPQSSTSSPTFGHERDESSRRVV
jgi:hypothetical protein